MIDPGPLLAGAEFIDAYLIAVDGITLDARQAAEKMFARRRAGSKRLALRNLIVAPMGLKTSGEAMRHRIGMVGVFPVLSETPERLVAGFDDKPSRFSCRGRCGRACRQPGSHHHHAVVRTHN